MSTTEIPIGTIDSAAAALLDSRLVILPTETVYGLAGRADRVDAVARIYHTKGRPSDHPVIVHVADYQGAVHDSWASGFPTLAQELAHAFWPGPLTLVLPRGPRSGLNVTGGQGTVALRVPAHPIAQAVLRSMDEQDPQGAPHGIAAPSANRFGKVSPTTVQHAITELSPYLQPGDLALDGGACSWGVESTIVDCMGERPMILRPGGVTTEDIAALGLDPVTISQPTTRVPGSLASHYAPRAQVVLHEFGALPADDVPADRQGFLALAEIETPAGMHRLAAPKTSVEYARMLYSALRAADDADLLLVVAVLPSEVDGVGAAVADRLRRAASPR
ncbi:MAG: L-threonylcarbamoyladenylate synthase [Candidatus Nanopelagicales bacterium]|jgi:L-threonylcarbamoyladenylate synthase|nr:L-threonylcarbamoyladenylate synthase [Candidatus Nanopelagicales bacterium]MDP4825106.1 L-threonylcarbamoyladenylate synthase [Candidatus Nanopelagicales bacterium]MDP4888456.1 L-threonylcarbamoyladenylate synthase [Candidatus Nanopelagicales bacterium]